MTLGFAPTLLASLMLVAAVAASGGRFRPDAWYATLRKPPGLPPRSVFPAVWTVLYLLMAVAAARIYAAPADPLRIPALTLYGAQLVANAVWSWMFFGRHSPLAALLDLSALFVLLTFTLVLFLRLDVAAGVKLLPYWLWLLVAFYLNAAVWWMNRPRRTAGDT
ncbi:TspO/MBR family protein [Acidihalobacter prosperus]